jgi:hypothetical protein
MVHAVRAAIYEVRGTGVKLIAVKARGFHTPC